MKNLTSITLNVFTYLSSLLVCDQYPQHASYLLGLGFLLCYQTMVLPPPPLLTTQPTPAPLHLLSQTATSTPPVSDMSLNPQHTPTSLTPPLSSALAMFHKQQRKGKEGGDSLVRTLKARIYLCIYCPQAKPGFTVLLLP